MGDLDNLRIISENDAIFPTRGQAELLQRITALERENAQLKEGLQRERALRAENKQLRAIIDGCAFCAGRRGGAS